MCCPALLPSPNLQYKGQWQEGRFWKAGESGKRRERLWVLREGEQESRGRKKGRRFHSPEEERREQEPHWAAKILRGEMKLRGSLACLLLTLCLGSGTASPLQNGGEASASQGMGDAVSQGVGEAVGQGAKEAASSGIQDALGQGHGEEGGYALRGARGDAFDHRLGEAARSLGNSGNEVGRQAEEVIRRGIDAVHNPQSWVSSREAGSTDGAEGGCGRNPEKWVRGRQMAPWWLPGMVSFAVVSLLPHRPPPPLCWFPLSCECQRWAH